MNSPAISRKHASSRTKRIAIAFATTGLLLTTTGVSDAVVLVVKSDALSQYDSPTDAFTSAYDGKIVELNLEGSREKGEQRLRKAAETHEIDAVFSLGTQAAYLTRHTLPDTPMVFAMALDWQRYGLDAAGTGVAVEMPADVLLTRFKLLLPNLSRLGVIYSEHASQASLDAAREAAEHLGIDLVEEDVAHAEEVAGAYRRMRGEIDALWMLPDPVVVTRDNFRYLAERTRSDGIGFLAFSENFVRAGALLSVSPDYTTMGSQAAVLVERLIEDGESRVPVQAPIGSSLVINAETARTLEIDVNASMMNMADLVINAEF
jgi:putative ABC transport system substrate-binding protein